MDDTNITKNAKNIMKLLLNSFFPAKRKSNIPKSVVIAEVMATGLLFVLRKPSSQLNMKMRYPNEAAIPMPIAKIMYIIIPNFFIKSTSY